MSDMIYRNFIRAVLILLHTHKARHFDQECEPSSTQLHTQGVGKAGDTL